MKLLALPTLVLLGVMRVTGIGVSVNSNEDAPAKRIRYTRDIERNAQRESFADQNNKDRSEVACGSIGWSLHGVQTLRRIA